MDVQEAIVPSEGLAGTGMLKTTFAEIKTKAASS